MKAFKGGAQRPKLIRAIGTCDGCHKPRRDIQAVGRDADGMPAAPCLCFLCRRLMNRGLAFDTKRGRYVPLGWYGLPQDEEE